MMTVTERRLKKTRETIKRIDELHWEHTGEKITRNEQGRIIKKEQEVKFKKGDKVRVDGIKGKVVDFAIRDRVEVEFKDGTTGLYFDYKLTKESIRG